MTKVCIDDFEEKLAQFVKANCKGVEISFQKVKKNNSLILNACVIRTSSNLAPSIYLNRFIEEIDNGRDMQDVFREILSVYEKIKINDDMELSWFMDWEQVKEKIRMKTINRSLNKDCILVESPNFVYLDLAVIFYVELPLVDGCGSIRICNNHLDIWGIDKRELLKQAKINLESEEFCIQSIENVMKERMGEQSEEVPHYGADNQLYVITTKNRLYGSRAILDGKTLERMSDMFGGKSYYVLPSSIHEILALYDTYSTEPELHTVKALKEIVRAVNDNEVEIDELLSYSIYFYNASSKILSIVG